MAADLQIAAPLALSFMGGASPVTAAPTFSTTAPLALGFMAGATPSGAGATLSAPTATATSGTTVTVGCTTDTASGTLYALASDVAKGATSFTVTAGNGSNFAAGNSVWMQSEADALSHVAAYTVAIDFSARDQQMREMLGPGRDHLGAGEEPRLRVGVDVEQRLGLVEQGGAAGGQQFE